MAESVHSSHVEELPIGIRLATFNSETNAQQYASQLREALARPSPQPSPTLVLDIRAIMDARDTLERQNIRPQVSPHVLLTQHTFHGVRERLGVGVVNPRGIAEEELPNPQPEKTSRRNRFRRLAKPV
jgi:hypothetical protein